MASPHEEQDWHELIDLLCFSAADLILGGAGFEEFRARLAGWADHVLDTMGLPRDGRPEALKQALATQLAYEFWNATPVPENRFRPRRRAKPERNASCPCGSGRKYKQCCGAAPAPALGITEELMLAHVLARWPKKRLKELPVREFPPAALARVADIWLAAGRGKDAVALLEALFAHLPELDGRAEAAADALLDAYLEIDAPRKKQRFIDALKGAPDRTLAATGWQRQAAILCDRGDYPAAWEAFREAQRLTPNAPALAQLEILLLTTEGRREEARARAEFWAARLARDPREDFSEFIALLRDLASGTPEGLLRAEARLQGPLAVLAEVIDAWPAPANHYTLTHGQVLTAKKPLAAIEALWTDLCPLYEAAPDGDAWERFLIAEPLTGQSFLILQDIADLLAEAPERLPGVEDALLKKILERAETLRETVLAALKAEGKALPWGALDNRPLLSLAALYIEHFAAERPARALELLRWSVLTANPSDNLGLREQLIHRLVEADQAGEAVAVAERYPDDFAFTEYGRVLALYAAGRRDEAARALAGAAARFPKVWKILIAKAPRRPKREPAVYTVGGEDEAWIYRDRYLPLWQSTGALAWGAALPAVRRRRGTP